MPLRLALARLRAHADRLGVVPSAILAREAGVTCGEVDSAIAALGIDPFRADEDRRALVVDNLHLCEQYDDDEVAERLGVTEAMVRTTRLAAGVNKYEIRKDRGKYTRGVLKVLSRIGREPDAVLAREAGVSRERIRQIRMRQTIENAMDAKEEG